MLPREAPLGHPGPNIIADPRIRPGAARAGLLTSEPRSPSAAKETREAAPCTKQRALTAPQNSQQGYRVHLQKAAPWPCCSAEHR